jgi:hypothetical protein
VHLCSPPTRTGLTTHHTTRNGTSDSKILDDTLQSSLGVARYPELAGNDVPRSHAQSPYEDSLTPRQTRQFAVLAKAFDYSAQRSAAATYQDQGGSFGSTQELVRTGPSGRVISHNLHLQCCLLTERLSEHRPKPVYESVIVAEPSGAVDDQQDSFNYGHRKLFHFTRDSAFVLRMIFARSVAAILTIFDVRFSLSFWMRNVS